MEKPSKNSEWTRQSGGSGEILRQRGLIGQRTARGENPEACREAPPAVRGCKAYTGWTLSKAGLERPTPAVHTGLGRGSAPSKQSRNAANSWSTGHQKCFASVAGIMNPG